MTKIRDLGIDVIPMAMQPDDERKWEECHGGATTDLCKKDPDTKDDDDCQQESKDTGHHKKPPAKRRPGSKKQRAISRHDAALLRRQLDTHLSEV